MKQISLNRDSKVVPIFLLAVLAVMITCFLWAGKDSLRTAMAQFEKEHPENRVILNDAANTGPYPGASDGLNQINQKR
jgi:nitrogen fixation-related uncharacterized protein